MKIDLDTRIVESPAATEVYISAVPDPTRPLAEQARDLFAGVRDRLESMQARILHERVFSTPEAADVLRDARSEVYGDWDDGVAPSYLVSQTPASCPIAGVQVHAVAGVSDIELVKLDGTPCGRVVKMADRTYLALSAIVTDAAKSATDQAQAIFQMAESILEQFDADFLSVARTWMWLGDILSWYDDFNHVRTEFFRERGLVGAGTRQSMPASTGIGLGPASGEELSMDLSAVIEPKGTTEYLGALGKQQCALEYGSAFSRASRAVTPAGKTVYVSGTASIDAAGATTNIGDAEAQIKTTIENVQAVIADMDLGDEDVVQVVAYCKTTDIEKVFEKIKDCVPWPWVTVICDVCRDDLLFEIEAAAMAGSKRCE
jgi:enamine deaminase RidA (YjgF/YER057c/UK114 family)